jgi:HTH-type transcriptional regulator, competence development regulator
MALLTAFGREVRKMRIDRHQTLKEMADALQVSSAYLSAVETGNKPIPDGFVPRVVKHFKLVNLEKLLLEEAAQTSQKKVEINLSDTPEDERMLAVVFARKFPSLSKGQAEKILELLKMK